MAWRSNKKGLAVVGLFLFLMGVVVPASFGLLTEKAMDLGVGDLLDKSTNWDESNIANSTYFVGELIGYKDNQTGTYYSLQMVYDDAQDLDLAMADTSGTTISSYNGNDNVPLIVSLNRSAVVKNVDKIVLIYSIQDNANVDLSKLRLIVYLDDGSWDNKVFREVFNATDAYNGTLRVEITLDALKRLKLESSSYDVIHLVVDWRNPQNVDLEGVVLGARVELYDVKKVNATAASNIMLAVSGVLGWLGALAATPYWNPMKNPEHRNIRGAYKKVRGKIRVPRRRR